MTEKFPSYFMGRWETSPPTRIASSSRSKRRIAYTAECYGENKELLETFKYGE